MYPHVIQIETHERLARQRLEQLRLRGPARAAARGRQPGLQLRAGLLRRIRTSG